MNIRRPAAQHGSGTGLGLYWVRAVAQRVQGNVRYARDNDEAVFTLSMPA